jgi:translation initiation factor 1
MSKNDDRTVWSSEQGDLRKKKDLTPGPSPYKSPTGVLRKGESLPPARRTVYLHRESSGRGGKAVTLLKKLKQECGTGGTIKEGVIEMQGEQRQRIADVLQKLGYKVKIAGG